MFSILNSQKIDTFWEIMAFVIIVIFVTWLLSRVIRFILKKILTTRVQDEDKLTYLFIRSSVKIVLGLIAIFYIIYTIPVLRSRAILIFSSAGIFAAIIGFAAQSAIANLVAGLFIVIFRPFRIGDYIKLDDQRLGIVTNLSLRHTIINNFENKRLIIPNSIISKESILNHSIEDSKVLTFNNFIVGMYADIDLARKIIQEEADKLPHIIDRRSDKDIAEGIPKVKVFVINTKESVIHLRAYVWIDGPTNEFSNKAILRESVHKRFVKEGVNLAIPLRKMVQ